MPDETREERLARIEREAHVYQDQGQRRDTQWMKSADLDWLLSLLPEGMTPDELERIASVLMDRGTRCGHIPLKSIQILQKWAEKIRRDVPDK